MKSKCGNFVKLDEDALEVVATLVAKNTTHEAEIATLVAHIEKLERVLSQTKKFLMSNKHIAGYLWHVTNIAETLNDGWIMKRKAK